MDEVADRRKSKESRKTAGMNPAARSLIVAPHHAHLAHVLVTLDAGERQLHVG